MAKLRSACYCRGNEDIWPSSTKNLSTLVGRLGPGSCPVVTTRSINTERSPPPEPATKVQRTEGEPETKEQLLAAAGACETITSADGSYDLSITSSGHLYMYSRYDRTLNDQSLCLIQAISNCAMPQRLSNKTLPIAGVQDSKRFYNSGGPHKCSPIQAHP